MFEYLKQNFRDVIFYTLIYQTFCKMFEYLKQNFRDVIFYTLIYQTFCKTLCLKKRCYLGL